MQLENTPFYTQYRYKSVADVFRNGFNENYWRHALTISQGNGMNVSERHVKERLQYIGSKLARSMFGNRWRKRKRKCQITFFIFKHGDEKRFDSHYHALMGIEGDHDWTDEEIADEIIEIDNSFPRRLRCTKTIDVQYDWEFGNQMHSYVSRYAQFGSDQWLIV